MKFTQEQRKQIFFEYMAWVEDVSDDLENKCYFSPDEIVREVLNIVEKTLEDE